MELRLSPLLETDAVRRFPVTTVVTLPESAAAEFARWLLRG
jgi:hypothetical protein